MTDGRRIAMVVACCVVAAITPFIAGWTAILGLVPLAYAIWLIARAGWALWVRVSLAVLTLAATGGLVTGFLILVTAGSGD